MARTFTREEADRLLPQIKILFGRIAIGQAQAVRAAEALGGVEEAERLLKGGAPAEGKQEAATQLKVASLEIVRCVELINEMGCLVKSVESGLVDFPCERDGKIIFLCWQYGEERLGFWHDPDGGYSSRKPLDDDMEPALLH